MQANTSFDIGKIQAYYQPIVRLDKPDMEFKKYEALMRYPLEDGKMGYPDKHIANIDNTEKFQATLKMLNLISETLEKNPLCVISLNIAFSDIEGDHANQLLENIRNSNNGDRLVLEFIEENELKNKGTVNNFMRRARELGCKFALDDFGKGYATFGPLLDFDFDILKFDENLTKDFTTDPKRFYILDMLISMCQRLEIETVAEYIETQEMYASARFMGCTYGQGHYEKLGEARPL